MSLFCLLSNCSFFFCKVVDELCKKLGLGDVIGLSKKRPVGLWVTGDLGFALEFPRVRVK